jgi:hypothetical protein
MTIARFEDRRYRSALAAFAVGTAMAAAPLCALAQATLHTSKLDPVTGAVTESKQQTFAASNGLQAELQSSFGPNPDNGATAFATVWPPPAIQVDIGPYSEADVHWVDNVVLSSPSVSKPDQLVVHGFVNIDGYRAEEGLNPVFTAGGSGMTSLSYTWTNPPPPDYVSVPYTLQVENGKIAQLDFNVWASAPDPVYPNPAGDFYGAAVIAASWGGVTSVTDTTTGRTLSNYVLLSPSSGIVYGSAVPEPAQSAMWLIGGAALIAIQRRRMRALRAA